MKEIPFNISARAARLIGQENFANADGAIIELVKNSYDADATVSMVVFEEVNNCLYIIDNGDGMTEEVILRHWMTIGTDHKNNNLATKKSRIKTGAKGIGRFALDRLGVTCQMVTKTTDSTATLWEVSWSQFDGAGKSLTDVKAKISESINFNFVDHLINELSFLSLSEDFYHKHFALNAGTIIKITNLRDQWNDPTIGQLFQNLEILIPPLETSSFSIYLYSASSPSLYGQVIPIPFDDFDYKLSAHVTKDHKVNVTIWRNELLVDSLKERGFYEASNLRDNRYQRSNFEQGYFHVDTSLERLLPGFKEVDRLNQLNRIGPFDFTFYFLKRGGAQERDENERVFPYKSFNYSMRAQALDRYGGVKIFRDNFRVRPYGEPKSSAFDWLDLGSRAASSPTVTKPGYRVRPNQVYGVISISRINNPAFQDKSNREGLQENETFQVLKQLLIAIIALFENDRNQIMMAVKKLYEQKNPRENAKSTVNEKIARFKTEASSRQLSSSSQSVAPHDELLKQALDVITTSEVAIKALEEDKEDLLDEQKILRVLASTGLTVASFAHELKNLSGALLPRTDNLKQVLNGLIEPSEVKHLPDYRNPYTMLADIRSDDERISQWLDFALSALQRDKRKRRKLDMVDYLERLQRKWSRLLELKGVKLTINKKQFVQVYFTAFEIDLDSIFSNLIANSVDAFTRPDAGANREILLSFSFSIQSGISVIYEDTGPGLSTEIIEPAQIVQPFFSTKRDPRTGEQVGTGLGMWLVKATIDEYKGTMEILPSRPGFRLRLTLPT